MNNNNNLVFLKIVEDLYGPQIDLELSEILEEYWPGKTKIIYARLEKCPERFIPKNFLIHIPLAQEFTHNAKHQLAQVVQLFGLDRFQITNR